jgi:hemoglobin/transferrin/lactoferrin receptor protein
MATRHFLTAALLTLPGAALAQSAAPTNPQVTTLPAVGVTATRGAKPIDEVPATVTITDDVQLERQSALRPSDVVRYEPGVTVGNQPARGGQSNYVIRGIGGNRVLILQDGMRVQDFPGTNEGAGTYTRDFTDLDSVKRVEILRGPASALYGSDALGGVVNYILKDPADYLDSTGRNVYFGAKLGYSGADSSLSETLTGAARAGKTEFMLLYTRRDGHQVANMGSVKANPQVSQSNALLGRMVIHASDADTIRLTGEYTRRRVSTQLHSEEFNSPPAGFIPGNNVLASHGRDTTWRGALSLDWTHDAPVLFIDSMRLRVSYSRLDRDEQTALARAVYGGGPAPTTANRLRLSDFGFTQNLFSADLQANTTRTLFGTEHAFTYGGSLDVTTTTRPRSRTEINLATGIPTNVVAGETFPNKNFPDTTTTQAGIFVQDEIRFGRLEVTPALRVDLYDLRPHEDAYFIRSSSGLTVHPLTQVSVSPKLGLLYHLSEQYSVYAQYAHGFRPPPYDSTNFGFTNAAHGYQILPNAGLKSETSDGVEIGVRGKYASASWQVSAFYNQYGNFIDTTTVGISPAGLLQFQYTNRSNVKIWGLEAKGDVQICEQVKLRGAFAWARGEDSATGKPFDSVDPIKLVAGVSWQNQRGLGADAVLTAALAHNRVSDPSYYKTPGYATLDLMAHYDVNANFKINAGIFNVFDAKYIVSQDVNGLASTSPLRDLYTQPGRYFAVNATMRW